jgi:hypothetical protein
MPFKKVYFNKIINKIKYVSSLREEMPKGSVLGPAFLLFVNDLPINIQDSRVVLFADDNKHSSNNRV